MLKDQLFLGRGWRYFTGVIDIDVTKHAEFKPPTKPANQATAARPGATTGPTTRKGRIIVGPSDD